MRHHDKLLQTSIIMYIHWNVKHTWARCRLCLTRRQSVKTEVTDFAGRYSDQKAFYSAGCNACAP